MDKGLTQHQVSEMIDVNRNFVYEMELNHYANTIYALHKVYLFLGFLPKVLKIDMASVRGRHFAHRIENGFTYLEIAKKIGLNKSTVGRFERGQSIKKKSLQKITLYLNFV